jgi:hypothetical protein
VPAASDTKLINEIAEWMAVEVKRRKKLDHNEAANEIRQRLQNAGPLDELAMDRLKLIVVTQERNDHDGSIREVYRLGPPILRAFRELTGKTVRWGKNDRYWVAVKQKSPHRWLPRSRLRRLCCQEVANSYDLIDRAGPVQSQAWTSPAT